MYDCAQMRMAMPVKRNAKPRLHSNTGFVVSPGLQKRTKTRGECASTPRWRKTHLPENMGVSLDHGQGRCEWKKHILCGHRTRLIPRGFTGGPGAAVKLTCPLWRSCAWRSFSCTRRDIG